jgi:hypothetical protein
MGGFGRMVLLGLAGLVIALFVLSWLVQALLKLLIYAVLIALVVGVGAMLYGKARSALGGRGRSGRNRLPRA